VPERYSERFENAGFDGKWAGYDPSALSHSAMYPNEVSSDFAFIPFGGGARKCVGDQFAVVEAASMLAVLLRRFEFSFPEGGPGARGVGMATGATIHTANGLNLAVRRRVGVEVDEVAAARAVAKSVVGEAAVTAAS
jgi:cytochrome P450